MTIIGPIIDRRTVSTVFAEISKDMEFFREAIIRVPKKTTDQYHTVLIPATGKKKHRLFCNCSTGKDPTCSHARELSTHVEALSGMLKGKNVATHFAESHFRKIFEAVGRGSNHSIERVTTTQGDVDRPFLIVKSGGTSLLKYYPFEDSGVRLSSRLTPGEKFSRAWLINKSASFVESEYERIMRSSGHTTVRTLEENSVWYRCAYHFFVEFTHSTHNWSISVDENTGVVSLMLLVDGKMVAEVFLPAKSVSGVLDILKTLGYHLPQHPKNSDEVEIGFVISASSDALVQCKPVVALLTGSTNYTTVTPAFCYGTHGYDLESDRFFRFSAGSLQRIATGWNSTKNVEITGISPFIDENTSSLSVGCLDGDAGTSQTDLFGTGECNDLARIVSPPVLRSFDRIELHPLSVNGSQWTIDLNYCCGDIRVSLGTLIEAKQRKSAYLFTDSCIVAMKSRLVTGALAQARGIGPDGVITLSSTSLMLLRGESVALHFDGDEKLIKKIKNMFSGKPVNEVAYKEDFTCTLRPYQANGVSWLHFLYDYHLGGLLCDEMGLGKTIQIIACINSLRAREQTMFVCIVCPTSVISHWQRLFERFSPTLQVVDYAKERILPERTTCDVVLMSYGLMRNDIDTLTATMFDIVVFDEVHQLKNRDTASYRAACSVRGRTVIGLTGTPVENSADDLESLFNLVLPGLTIDVPSESALLSAINLSAPPHEIFRFRQKIEPFILRRLKANVLTELPPKTEENRYCSLSDYQMELYSTALEKRGLPLVQALRDGGQAIPYIHIFALMNYLKQVCNTPALVCGTWEEYPRHESGKWELFKELLDESLGSGQKVVVFTQFLAMVDIFSHYLNSLGIGHVTLTGATVHREKCISQFNDDPSCRVFIGSLKAGGVGIDLVAGSVVIHYDRWWNAAREDQATDRVHRIGQKNGVQVFKLITDNSLEERIDRIISRKKSIAEHTLTDDDPDAVKQYTREELMGLISR